MRRIYGLFIFISSCVFAQNNNAIDKANKSLKSSISRFDYCLIDTCVKKCSNTLTNAAKDEYQYFVVGQTLLIPSPNKSSSLFKKSYSKNKNNPDFLIKYANSLHRNGQYTQAIELYKKHEKTYPNNLSIHVWLSECYINIGQTKKAIEEWKLANHSKNQIAINEAIHKIHLNTSQHITREKLRKRVSKGDTSAAFDLIYLDMNWEYSWWKHDPNKEFAEADLFLIKYTFGKKSSIYDNALAYTSIKTYAKSFLNVDHVKHMYLSSGLVINNGKLVPSGKITSDLITVALNLGLIQEQSFYQNRNRDLVDLINKTKSGELANLYIYLEETVKGKQNNELNKKGWKEFNDEKCAVSYFLVQKNQLDPNELKQAIKDFPNSAKLEAIHYSYLKDKASRVELISLIQKEFKTLNSNDFRYSTNLNEYFRTLSNYSKTSQ